MNTDIRSKLVAVAYGLCLSLFASTPILADDTEVFTGGAPTPADGIYPNVLFILDTSGSMGPSSGNVGDTGKTRMENMKEALNLVLDSTTNVNVGLMRFNDPGGPILYPVSYIDEDVTVATASASDTSVNTRIKNSNDDAQQLSGGLGTMYLDGNTLELAHGVGASTSTTITASISTNTDDEEQNTSTGNMAYNGNQIDMNDSQTTGFRFQNIAIPTGATIQSARIRFTARRSDSSDVALRFNGETNDSGTFLNINNNISSRVKTSAFADWEPGAWNSGNQYWSPDLSSVVQEMVNDANWASGNSMVFIETHVSGGQRRAYSRNDSTARAALLEISYTTEPAAAQMVGLRFQDINIPQGATIVDAYIEFTAAQDRTNDLTLSIQAHASDDAPAFTTAAYNISSRANTTAAVTWSTADSTLEGSWNAGAVYQTPSLNTVVQEIVNRDGWCGTQSIAFNITSDDTVNRVVHSYDGDASLAPVLRVQYDDSAIPDGGGCIHQDQIYRISADNNDAEETISGGAVTLNGNQLDMNTAQVNGLRFDNLFINQGAEILSAHIEFNARRANTGAASFVFKGHASDNAGVFTSGTSNISSRTTTSASVTWSLSNGADDWVANSTYSSPDLKSIVQEVVNRDGWAPGNAVAFIQTANAGSGTRRARTYDDSPGASALLRIRVKHGGASETISKKVRSRLKEIINEFVPGGWTPIVDTLYEAANYYRGGPVLYGKSRGDRTIYGRLSHPDSYTGGTYVANGCDPNNLNSSGCANETISGEPIYTSPIESTCQSNYVVLLTDGQANHNHSEALIRTLTGLSSCDPNSGNEACGRELAEFMADNDQGLSITGKQPVNTYTIGFNLDEGGQADAITFLRDVARVGGGTYQSASTAADLVGVFQNIIRNIQDADSGFVAPAVAVSQFNRLVHQNEVYFSLFKPSDKPEWPGNLKRYAVSGNPAYIVDANGAKAVDISTGFFKDNAKSYWSDLVDGADVELGGAAGEVGVNPLLANRKVFTYTGTSTTLSNDTNALHESNDAITLAMLGIEGQTADYRTTLLQWARGVDTEDSNENGSTTDARQFIGAPLHSNPTAITYGTTSADPDNTIYFGTNNGMLHAIDADNGAEVFSFVPQELLSNLDVLYRNAAGSSLPYGLDGTITVWYNGSNKYLYLGMRRGGQNYYALDVTDRANPSILWTIFGGSEGDFSELGQTWSRPLLSKVNIGGTVKNVLIFAGGYDDNQDGVATRTVDTQGRAIFMVDALTGAKVWSGGLDGSHSEVFTDMKYSIPSDMRVIDMNGDGLADQMYVGDMGGQLWRFDIHNGEAVADFVTGGVIGDFSGDAAADNRRFFYAPDVALVKKGTDTVLSIAVGSGYRAHPLNTTIADRFYMLRSTDVFGAPETYTKLVESDLYDATNNIIGQGSDADKATAVAELNGKSGWLIQLSNSGEKVLAESVTVNNQIIFTTYQPGVSASACSAGNGIGRTYVVNVLDATPTLDLNASGDEVNLTKEDRSVTLTRAGIPPEPTVLFPDADKPIIAVGPEQPLENFNFGDLRDRTYWHESSN